MSGRKIGEVTSYDVVRILQAEEDFIGLVVIAVFRRLERLDEVDVEITFGLCCWPVVWRTEKQVPVALYAAILPLDLILPDLVPSDVSRLIRSYGRKLVTV